MSHLADSVLAMYDVAPHLLPDRASVDAHLDGCRDCQRRLSEHRRDFDELLADPEVWAALPQAADEGRAHDEIQELAGRVADEDDRAAELLAPYDGLSPAAFVWENLPSKRELHTGGVVRLLCRKARATCERDPLHALSLADAAVAISEALPDELYPRGVVRGVRGDAWKEKANALDLLGRYSDAWKALDSAEKEYRQLPHAGAASTGIVSVTHIRASLLYEQERFDEAERLASDAARDARHLGLTDHYMRARHLQGLIRADQHQYAAAASVFRDLLGEAERLRDDAWIARESLALGGCDLEMGALQSAARLLLEARNTYSRLGFDSEVTRVEWCFARLRLAEGRTDDGIATLRSCMASFARREMLLDAALVALDLAEALAAQGRSKDASRVLAGVVDTFTRAGKLNSALTALTYVRDFTGAGRALSPDLSRHVRRFIVRAERDPELIFHPPLDASL